MKNAIVIISLLTGSSLAYADPEPLPPNQAYMMLGGILSASSLAVDAVNYLYDPIWDPFDTMLWIGEDGDVTGSIPGFIHGVSPPVNNSADLAGKNLFYIQGKTLASNTRINSSTDPIGSVVNYGDYLYYYAAGSQGAGWTNNVPLLQGKGRALWTGAGSIMGVVLNENNNTIISDDASALTFSGNVTSVTNNGQIQGAMSAIEISPDGTVGAITNSGVLTGSMGIMNAGHITGDIINTGTINGGIVNYGIVDGSIALGGAELILAGDNAAVGAVSGNGASSVTIGRSGEGANFRAINSLNVGTLNIVSGSQLTLAENLNWQANSVNNNGTTVLSNGSMLTSNLSNTGTLALSTGQYVNATLTGDLSNQGNLVLNPSRQSAGNTLTINGNYLGEPGSKVLLGTVLGGDQSLTDKLVITGNSAGTSALSVVNENGAGSSTLEGIKLVQVNGDSDAVFTLDGRVVAGEYDYSLVKGNASASDTKDWYLTSHLTSYKVRPEAASYADNLRAANTLFALSLHDRSGETQYVDPLTGETRTTSMWIRNVGGHNESSMADGQNKTTANRYVLQIGGDLIQWADEQTGKFSLGLMGGYANQKSHTRNSTSGYDSRGAVNGYSAGLYASWYQNARDKSGAYADSWLQYGWFNNEVKGQDLAPETYKSRGLTASLESGYNYRITTWTSRQGMENSVWLQPHAQVIWMGVKADDHTESNGTRVESEGDNNVQTRLGLRAYLNGKSVLDKNTAREFQPFIETNWVYNTRQYGSRLNGDPNHLQGARNIGELKLGVEGKLSSRFSLWTDIAQQIGGEGYSDTQGTLGMRYQF